MIGRRKIFTINLSEDYTSIVWLSDVDIPGYKTGKKM